PRENLLINLLGQPKLLTIGDGSSPTMHDGGGRLTIDFSPMGSVTMKSFVVYDIDDADEGSLVELFSGTGQLLKSKKLPKTDKNDITLVGFDGDVSGVTKMVVTFGEGRKLAGSGAISRLQLCPDGAGQCWPSSGTLQSMWMQYTGDKPANVKVSTRNGAAASVIFSENGMKPGDIFKVESLGGLGEAVLIETNRKESHTILTTPGEGPLVVKQQYGSFKVLDARDDWGAYPMCLQ
ncbi:hypothetical protein OB13_17660, partial [Pontibacter sp. HJ8]